MGKSIVVIAAILFAAAFLATTLLSENMQGSSLYPNSEPPPNSNTTTAAPGYTSNYLAAPFNNKGPYPPTPGADDINTIGCTALIRSDTRERASEVPLECKQGQEKIGLLCYTSCPEKWKPHMEFPDTCYRCKDYSDSCDFIDMIVHKRTRVGTATECKPGLAKYGGLCFHPCPQGYKPEGNLCIRCAN